MREIDGQLLRVWNAPALRRLRPALAFFFVWTLLPSLAFLSIWITGGPIRTPAIVLYLLVGLAALKLPLAVAAVLYLPVLLLDLVWLVSGFFNLSPLSTIYAVKYLGVLRPFSSATYAGFAVLLLGSAVALFILAGRWRATWRAVSLSGACFGALFLLAADMAINLTPEYGWGRVFRATAPFDSAMRNSGLAERDIAGERRDLLVVMVESWGSLADPAQDALVRAPLRRADIAARYAVTSGSTVYYGSTTAAEFRELCGRWDEFEDYTGPGAAAAGATCLPARLGAAGYDTVAFHGFTGRMFDRRLWYPTVGFRDVFFRDDLADEDLRLCAGVFAGICDVDLAGPVERALIDGRDGDDRPRFVYWLTLNSHLPVDPTIDIAFLDCDGPGDPFAQKQVCHLADQWMQVFDKVADMLANEALRPLDVLLVGDHAPPFWTREGKSFFVRGEVPWIRLSARATPADLPEGSAPLTRFDGPARRMAESKDGAPAGPGPGL